MKYIEFDGYVATAYFCLGALCGIGFVFTALVLTGVL